MRSRVAGLEHVCRRTPPLPLCPLGRAMNPKEPEMTKSWSFPAVQIRALEMWPAFCLAVCLAVIVTPVRVNAQALSGMNGTVTDASGAVVPGANVMITNDATGVVTKTVTTTAGTYSVTDLNPGSYTVRVEATGFQAAVIKGVYVDVARRST